MGDRGPELGSIRHEVCPLSGVLLQGLDGRAEWRFPPEREGLQEGQIALPGGLLGGEALDGLLRLPDQSGGARLDEEQQGLGAPGGHAAEDLVARQQVVGRHASRFRRVLS
jgi:hypothetical protein